MKFTEFKSKNNKSRIIKLTSSGKTIETPTFFPAISSIGTAHDIRSLMQLIMKSSFPQVLISAYDYDKNLKKDKKLLSAINNFSKNHVIFVDSGGFEKYWKKDNKWNQTNYEKIMIKIPSDYYTSFDTEFNSKIIEKKLFQNIIKSGLLLPTSQYLPIFHSNSPRKIIELIKKFIKTYDNAIGFIAIREKECGNTIQERCKTIYEIRKIIDSINGNQLIHVLGTGNPLSIALYSYSGADIFDSTDWSRFVFDFKNNILRDKSHLELLNCPCRACKKIKNFHSKVLLHNLDSYLAFMQQIRMMIKQSKLKKFLIKNGIEKKLLSDLK